MTHIAPVVSVIFASSLVIWTDAESSILCAWTKAMPTDEVHYSFLRSNPRQASPSLRLYHSSWSAERALLSCAWSDDAAVVQNYLSACRERTHEFSDHQNENVNVSSLFEGEDLCASVASSEVGGVRKWKRPARSVHGPTGSEPDTYQGQDDGSEGRKYQRVKRGFIVPGTLWCGSGNKAPSYQDLGVFSETDNCCREHDQCKHTILSFHSEFGVFNSNIFTMSHCDCDNKFRSCLMEAEDSISDAVGYTFFNLLKMHCFEFSHRLTCTQRNWFGMCKETTMTAYAVVHPPTLYESNNPPENDSSIMNSTTSAEPLQSTTSHPRLHSKPAAGHSAPTPSACSPSASCTPAISESTSTVPSKSEGPTGPAPESRDHLENISSTRKQQFEINAGLTEKQLSCGAYKDLDVCKTKIPPQQRRYGLHNVEATTLYHCNCTTRLFQTLANQREMTEVQALLLGRVSLSCFLPQDCTAGKICTPALVRAALPQLDHRSSADLEKQRHLQAVRLKVRGSNNRTRRKHKRVRLHKLCLMIG